MYKTEISLNGKKIYRILTKASSCSATLGIIHFLPEETLTACASSVVSMDTMSPSLVRHRCHRLSWYPQGARLGGAWELFEHALRAHRLSWYPQGARPGGACGLFEHALRAHRLSWYPQGARPGGACGLFEHALRAHRVHGHDATPRVCESLTRSGEVIE